LSTAVLKRPVIGNAEAVTLVDAIADTMMIESS
jgi:hypothetical protein